MDDSSNSGQDGNGGQDGGQRPVRPWWRKKRWWAAGALAVYFATYFIPYSLTGPAMSCWTALSEVESDASVYNFAIKNGMDVEKTISFITRSDFRLRNTNSSSINSTILVYTTNYRNISCFLFNLFSIDGSIVLLEINKKNGDWKIFRIGTEGK